jgi:hypothetical protein
MKQKIKNIGLMLAVMWIAFSCFTACEKEYDPMIEEVVDLNSNITAVDKTITEPGDIVTFTGKNLDKVYLIMFNEEPINVQFTATASELKMTVPSQAPLGDVVTINLFFSGKGLAQRTIKIISPPQIMEVSPIAAYPGEELTILGRELYLAQSISIGGIEATFTVIDDKTLTVTVPDGFAGGNVVITTETGGESLSPSPVILGTELLVTNIDTNGDILNSFGPYSNASGAEASDDFPRNKVYVITIEDNGSSWGANCDFNLKNMPATINGNTIDLTKVEMVADVKASKTLSFNFMVGKNHNPPGLWGKTTEVTQEWQTITVPFTALGQGYGGDPISDDPLIPFEEYTMIKWSLPASADQKNFGETITFDKVKFIIRD